MAKQERISLYIPENNPSPETAAASKLLKSIKHGRAEFIFSVLASYIGENGVAFINQCDKEEDLQVYIAALRSKGTGSLLLDAIASINGVNTTPLSPAVQQEEKKERQPVQTYATEKTDKDEPDDSTSQVTQEDLDNAMNLLTMFGDGN